MLLNNTEHIPAQEDTAVGGDWNPSGPGRGSPHDQQKRTRSRSGDADRDCRSCKLWIDDFSRRSGC